MFMQLEQLKTLAGVERLCINLNFLPNNKARLVVTCANDTEKATDNDLCEALKRPIVVEGTLGELDTFLTTELLNADRLTVTPVAEPAPTEAPQTVAQPTTTAAPEPIPQAEPEPANEEDEFCL